MGRDFFVRQLLSAQELHPLRADSNAQLILMILF